jgi:hypothetical protein
MLMRRSFIGLLTALMAAALSLAVVQPVAARPPVRSEGSLVSAIGSTSLETSDTLVFFGLEIYTDGVNAQAHVSRATYALNGSEDPLLLTEEYGTVNLEGSDVIVADDLSSVVLPAVAADLWDCGDEGCTPTETVTVAAMFTGNAPASTTVERIWDRSPDCRTRSTTVYEGVVATMSLDFDGVVTSWDEAGVWRETWNTRTWGCDA